MTNKEIFQIWAPAGKKWVDWVRPVPFVAMKECSKQYWFSDKAVAPTDYADATYEDAAIIVDLPGAESVNEGIKLAQAGYRPIPIYNGTIEQHGARATVDNQSVAVALALGADRLRDIVIPEDALPAFLLDSNRMHRFKMEVSVFDNSWDIYPQDIPSADYLLKNGIGKIIIVGNAVSKDLRKILYDYQKKRIQIYFSNRYEAPKKITLRKPLRKGKD
ncbi:MAG: hypothetical protein E7291_05485 [Lachnospiraceae bacterium]|nr:hypothetical protein [Lachnospiraceae bacterium]